MSAQMTAAVSAALPVSDTLDWEIRRPHRLRGLPGRKCRCHCDRSWQRDDFQVGLYLVDVTLAALTTAFILLPVSVHRRLFRKRLKETFVTSSDMIAKIALSGVAALSAGTSALVFDVLSGRSAGITAGLVFLAVMVLLLVYVPMHLRRQAKK